MNKKFVYRILLLVIIFSLLFIREIGRQAYLHNIRWLYLFFLSFTISYFLTPITIKYAYKYNILDIPDTERKIHDLPTPRVAGIALSLAFFITLLRNVRFVKEISGLLIASTLVFIIALFDDIYNLPASIRLVGQIIAALIVIFFGFRITAIPKNFPFEALLEVLITIIWIVGVTNAVAFLDGIDGLVLGFGAFCSLLFLIISLLTKQKFVSFLSASLLGACLGVLPFNWYKAKTFLGECGSSVIGFVLASISIIGWWAEKQPIVSLSTPVLILAVPIFDICYITISRIRNGVVKNFKEWIEYTGKDHIHHRFLNLGFNVPQSVGIILLITFCLGLYSIVIRYCYITDIIALIILLQSIMILVVLSIIMYKGRQKKNQYE